MHAKKRGSRLLHLFVGQTAGAIDEADLARWGDWREMTRYGCESLT